MVIRKYRPPMAKKRTPAPEPQPANLSAQEIKTAIPKLERRLRELQGVEFDNIEPGFIARLDRLQTKLDGTLVEIFGANTLDYHRHRVYEFSYDVPMTMGQKYSEREMAGYYEKPLSEAASKVETVLDILREQLEDMGETTGRRALQAYQGLELHPEIALAASNLYRDEHYANAIEEAVKALNALVRLRSGVDDLDGSALMKKVFSPKKPVLQFNAMADESDENEQEGFMMMFCGAVAGLRNPRAHKLIEDDPERALEFIAFVSLLAKLLDGAKKVPPQ